MIYAFLSIERNEARLGALSAMGRKHRRTVIAGAPGNDSHVAISPFVRCHLARWREIPEIFGQSPIQLALERTSDETNFSCDFQSADERPGGLVKHSHFRRAHCERDRSPNCCSLRFA